MLAASWISILRTIPADHHPKLVLATASGTEINLQAVLRIEKDYLMIQGRLAASTEAGRVFFLPFDQINFLGFREGMKEADITAMFGEAPAQAPTDAPEPLPIEHAPLDTVVDTGTKTDGPGSPTAGAQALTSRDAAGGHLPQSAKAALLERLRKARSANGAVRAGT
jgi:hypothetical protein